mmetsp:Transcript_11001/g.45671  ORF Transcript_11001/g.45671 Transcript_11001/m.45671 type:complete len:304 (+) Transcript_11001:828-1739(+)
MVTSLAAAVHAREDVLAVPLLQLALLPVGCTGVLLLGVAVIEYLDAIARHWLWHVRVPIETFFVAPLRREVTRAAARALPRRGAARLLVAVVQRVQVLLHLALIRCLLVGAVVRLLLLHRSGVRVRVGVTVVLAHGVERCAARAARAARLGCGHAEELLVAAINWSLAGKLGRAARPLTLQQSPAALLFLCCAMTVALIQAPHLLEQRFILILRLAVDILAVGGGLLLLGSRLRGELVLEHVARLDAPTEQCLEVAWRKHLEVFAQCLHLSCRRRVQAHVGAVVPAEINGAVQAEHLHWVVRA